LADDGRVLAAIIEHTIRPYVRKHAGPSAAVFVIDHTAPICERGQDPRNQPFCLLLSALSMRSDFSHLVENVVPSAAHRGELLSSLKERNVVRHRLPVSGGPELTMVASPPEAETPSEQAPPYVLVGLPGYSSGGHALVSALINCGPWCGGQFEWLLEKRGAEWNVRIRDGFLDLGSGRLKVLAEPEKIGAIFAAPSSTSPAPSGR
jgi:hypothetical protein